MATFLLTWNPNNWDFDEGRYDELVRLTSSGSDVNEQWSTGSRSRGITPGDPLFLVRQGSDRGIVAAGHATSEIFEGPHWDGSNRYARYVAASWQTVLDLSDRLAIERLRLEAPQVTWQYLQGSGVMVPDAAEEHLHEIWAQHLRDLGIEVLRSADEIAGASTYREGAVKQVVVNRYERDPHARSACLAHYGLDCIICGFNFEKAYGDLGRDYIVVHHVRELSTLGPGYKVDPVADLVPLCPNCHAMVHQRSPALSPSDVRAALEG